MRPKSEQDEYNEAVANTRLKLAPKKDFKRLLNGSYDPIANAMSRHTLSSRKKRLWRWQKHLGFNL